MLTDRTELIYVIERDGRMDNFFADFIDGEIFRAWTWEIVGMNHEGNAVHHQVTYYEKGA